MYRISAPMSFWYLEILFLMVPMIIFVTYCSHRQHSQLLLTEDALEDAYKTSNDRYRENEKDREERIKSFFKAYNIMVYLLTKSFLIMTFSGFFPTVDWIRNVVCLYSCLCIYFGSS